MQHHGEANVKPVNAVKGRDLCSQETPVYVHWENLPRRKGYLTSIQVPYKFSLFQPSFSLLPFCCFLSIIQS